MIKIWTKIFALIAIAGITTSLMPPTAFALKALETDPQKVATGGAIAVGGAAVAGAEFGTGIGGGILGGGGGAAAAGGGGAAAGGTGAAAGGGAAAAILVVPVFDAINLAAQAVDTTAQVGAQGADTFAKITRWGLEDLFKIMLAALKKKILDMLVDQIVMWIQGGGEPKFVNDWSGFLKDAMNETTGTFIDEVGLAPLCETLAGTNLKIAVQASLLPIKRFSERSKCTLQNIVENIEDFANDFRAGGWLAYSASWNPENNFFGIIISASAELEDRQSAAAGALWSEAQAGAGFLSTKKCVETVNETGLAETEKLELADQAIQQEEGGKAISQKYCTKYEITTPGKTIGDTLSKAVGSDIDYIVNADELSEYIAAIADAIINRIIKEGVAGIAGLVTPKAPRRGVIFRGAAGDHCSSFSGEARTACENYNNAKSQRDFQVEFFEPEFFDPNEEMRFASNPEQFLKEKINEIIAVLNSYIQNAQGTYNQLAVLPGAICPQQGSLPEAPRTEIMSVVQNTIQFEQGNITTLRQISPSNNDDLRSLAELKTALISELQRSIDRTNNNLELFQARLQQCGG